MAQRTRHETFGAFSSARPDKSATLHKTRYTDTEFLRREWDSVWTRCWLFAGLEADAPEAGDYFLFELGAESVVVMRQEDGQLAAFYNVCQHRGNRLFVSSPGSVRSVVCPYHGWRYELGGRLCEVPDWERFSPPPDPQNQSLKPVRLETWAGLVWINMDSQAVPLRDYLAPVMDTLAPYRFEQMRLVQHQVVALDANWKTVRDNFLEQYHVDFIHPQHAGFVDCCNSENTLWPLGHSATRVAGFVTNSRYPVPDEVPDPLLPFVQGLGLDPAAFRGRMPEMRRAVQARKRELGPELGFDYDGLSDEQLSDVWQYDIFPNTFMTIQPEELWIFGPRPHSDDPGKCYFDKFTLQVPRQTAVDDTRGLALHPALLAAQPAERPDTERLSRDEILAGTHSLTITIDQDIQYLPDMQAGLRSRGFQQAVLNEDEIRVQHFHDWLDAWLSEDAWGSTTVE